MGKESTTVIYWRTSNSKWSEAPECLCGFLADQEKQPAEKISKYDGEIDIWVCDN